MFLVVLGVKGTNADVIETDSVENNAEHWRTVE